MVYLALILITLSHWIRWWRFQTGSDCLAQALAPGRCVARCSQVAGFRGNGAGTVQGRREWRLERETEESC